MQPLFMNTFSRVGDVCFRHYRGEYLMLATSAFNGDMKAKSRPVVALSPGQSHISDAHSRGGLLNPCCVNKEFFNLINFFFRL